MTTLYQECTRPLPEGPHRGKGGTPIQTHTPLSIPPKRRADRRKAYLKRKVLTTRDPLRCNDPNGETTGIGLVLERYTPPRIKHNRRSIYVEELLVQWDPEDCALQEAQTQQAQGFVITSITNLDVGVPTPLIQAATATKRPRGRPKTSERLPPYTKCRVQFAPSSHGPTHIRTILGGEAVSDAFLPTETTRPPTPPPGNIEPPGPTPTTRSPRVHAPSRTTRRSHTPPPPSSPARPPLRTHTDLLQIIMEKGDPDRDSIPREGPYVSLVPSTFAWSTLEKT